MGLTHPERERGHEYERAKHGASIQRAIALVVKLKAIA
jgi:hypothetical protein